MRGFRGLTFDAYGSLLQGGPSALPSVLKRLATNHGRAITPATEHAWRRALKTQYAADPFIAFREVHRKAFQEMFRQLGIEDEVEGYIDEAFDEYREVRAYSEVSSVLRHLETEVAMAVVSNMDTKILLEALHRNGLAFTFVIASEEEQRYKPSPSIFQRAIRYLGLPARNILHVGDSYDDDVVGAASVGMGSLLIRRAAEPSEPPPTKGQVVENLVEVREFVRRSWD